MGSKKNRFLYNDGAERQDDLNLNIDLTNFRAYDPALGRWWQIDPLADQEDLVNWTPYNYSFNNPVRFNDPLGDIPPQLVGAFFGAAIDAGLQLIEIGLSENKTLDDFSAESITVSSIAGATGVGLATKLRKTKRVVRLLSEVVVDGAASTSGQLARDGEVDITETVIDVTAGQTVGKAFTRSAKSKALKTSKGKRLQTEINRQKNIARGKSNTTPKNKADVEGAEGNLTAFQKSRAIGASTASSGAATTFIEQATKAENKPDRGTKSGRKQQRERELERIKNQ